jgi:hypothetical protein
MLLKRATERFTRFGSSRNTIESRERGMTDNVLQTLQHAIQDVIAPDVRELKVRVASIERQMETQYTALEKQIETRYSSLRDQQDANFKAIMAAIGESRAKTNWILISLSPHSQSAWLRLKPPVPFRTLG